MVSTDTTVCSKTVKLFTSTPRQYHLSGSILTILALFPETVQLFGLCSTIHQFLVLSRTTPGSVEFFRAVNENLCKGLFRFYRVHRPFKLSGRATNFD